VRACARDRPRKVHTVCARARRVRPGANSRPVVVGRWSSRCATGSCRRRSSFSIHHLSSDCYKYIPSSSTDLTGTVLVHPGRSLFGRNFCSCDMDYHYDVMNCRTPKEQFAEGVSVSLKCIHSRPRCTTYIGLAAY
jgi:hypothetical protein